ncbi:MAG TPA: dihydroorotase [Gammaproteobacteria bacterium]|jgi:dihydroorotase|nr:dihydroorotase [Gammaproteobacteria bacterium]
MSTFLIRHAHIIDPANNIDAQGDLYIAHGKLQPFAEGMEAEYTLDATGLVAIPGLIDLYARLREPGQEKKATIASETLAALHGGITTLICSPDTDPVIDETATVELIHRRNDDAGFARVVPLAAMTQHLDGQQISELATLRDAGCVAASQADCALASVSTLRSIMEYAATFDIKLSMLAQDASLAGNGVMHEGLTSTRMGLVGVPVVAETVALSMILELAWQTGAAIHFSRITSARGLALIRDAKAQGLNITADTSINHLFLTDKNVTGFNSLCHTQPPLRSAEDRQALRDALSDGTLDAICTDHAPHDPDAKLAPFPASEPGISGLDTFLPLLLRLVDETPLSVSDVIRLASAGPAQLMGLDGGTLTPGAVADVVLLDPTDNFTCDPHAFRSKGHNSPYEGSPLKGVVKHAFVSGQHYPLSQVEG